MQQLRHCKMARFIKGNFTRVELLELICLMFLGLVVFTWYSSNIVIDAFDYNISFSPGQTLSRSLQLWDPHGGFGHSNPRNIAGIFPTNLYYSAMDTLGASLHTAQSILLYVVLAGSGVSVFLLYRALGLGERYRNGAIFAAVLYMFSPIASTFLWNQFASNYYSYCFLPLIAAMVIYGIRTKRGPFYIFIVIMLWTLLVSAAYMNPVNAFMDWLFIFGLIGVFVLKESDRRKQVIKYAAILAIFWLLVNIFWIVPLFNSASLEFTKSDVSTIGVSNLELLKSNSVPFYGAALQTGYWALYHTYLGDHWYSWSGLASSLIYIISCLIIALTALYAFVIRPRNQIILLLGGFTALCLVMINGYYPPTGDLLVALFNQIPALYAFRSLYQHFGPMLALCYSILVGYTMAHLIGSVSWPKLKGFSIRQTSLKQWAVMSWTVLIVLALSVVAIPYFTGEVIYDGGNVIPSARVQVPDYYYQANDFLNNASGDFRVLSLPYCHLGYAVYNWDNGYWGGDPSSTIFDRVVIVSESGEANQLLSDIAIGVTNNYLNFDLGKMLSIMNVRYIMLHQDADWEFIQGQSPPWWAAPQANFSMYDSGLKNAGMVEVATFGELVLYENPEWKEIHFLQVNQMLAVVGGLSAVENMTLESWYDVSKMAFVMVPSIEQAENLSLKVDAIYVDHTLLSRDTWKLQDGLALNDTVGSSTLHGLSVQKGQRYLIFSERYDQGWTITNGNASSEHLVVNLFFNGWATTNQTTNVTLEYQPQRVITMLGTFSIIFTIGTFSYFSYRHLRRSGILYSRTQ
jgi:hypothetical protein